MQRDGDIVAAGEVNGHSVEVIYRKPAMEIFYTWTATDDGKVYKTDGRDYPTVDRAMTAAIEFLIPGAEVVELPPAGQKDLDALNALLYVGGLQEDIKTVQEAIEFRNMFVHALEAVQAVKAQAPKDMEEARLIVASTHGAFHQAAMNVSKISGVFEAQCTVFEMILERSIETIDAFLSGYGD